MDDSSARDLGTLNEQQHQLVEAIKNALPEHRQSSASVVVDVLLEQAESFTSRKG
jgi:hypothetical protein